MKGFTLAAAMLLAAAAASGEFEGVADFKITMNTGQGKPIPSEGKMFLTRNAYRMEWETDLSGLGQGRKETSHAGVPEHIKMTVFAKLAEPGKLFMINDQNRTYSVWDTGKTREELKNLEKDSYSVRRLGSDTVAGLSCQKALITSSRGNEAEVCVTRDLTGSGDWLAAMNSRQGDTGSWMKALKDSGIEGFPIRYAMRRKGAAEPFMTMELTRVEKKRLPASLFEVPAGYRVTDSAVGGLTPEQEKAMRDSRAKMKEAMDAMTPEQRKAYEDMMKKYGRPTPKP